MEVAMNTSLAAGRVMIVSVACLIAACDSYVRSGGWGARVVTWSERKAGEESVPGIDEAAVNFGVYGDGYALVIWSDGGGSFGTSWDKSRNAVKYEGGFTARDGRKYAVECLTADGRTGSVTIDGQAFQLEDGSFFLVAGRSPRATVKQLRREMPQAEKDSLRDLAENDPEIKSFFEEPPTAP
jgi:hypothetical protein